jgi:hypothetical protein
MRSPGSCQTAPLCGASKPLTILKECGLASTVPSDHADALARLDPKAGLVEKWEMAIGHRDLIERDERHPPGSYHPGGGTVRQARKACADDPVSARLARPFSDMRLAVGSRLGQYEIIALIGAGGMGEVYRARDPKLNRHVALKILPAAFAADRERLARFPPRSAAPRITEPSPTSAISTVSKTAKTHTRSCSS